MALSAPFWMTKLAQLYRLVRESHANPIKGSQQKPPQISPTETAITFIGHSSFLVQTSGRALLIDPVFATRLILLRRQRLPGIHLTDLPPIDAVLITHAHMDHLDRPSLRAIIRAMRKRKSPAPIAVVPSGVEDLVQGLGFAQIIPLEWWQTAFIPSVHPDKGISVTATPAKHWGARLFRDTHRGFGGYIVQTVDSPTIYHSGDTAYFSGFREISRRFHPEVALLPIGAYFPDSYRSVHTSPEEALQAFLDLEAETMIPMHYNTFRLGREPMDEPLTRLVAAARRLKSSSKIVILEEGQSWKATNNIRDTKKISIPF